MSRPVSRRAAGTCAVLAAAALALSGCSEDAAETSERVTIEVPTTVTVTANPLDGPSNFTHYVALGDSYAAMGSASGPFEGPDFCARSTDNYPHVLAETYKGINAKRGFTDATCQGATTEHILNTRDIDADPPEQVLAARATESSTGASTETATDEATGRAGREASSSAIGTATSEPTATGATGTSKPTEANAAADANSIEAQIEALESYTDLITLSIGGNDINFGPWSRCLNGMFSGKGESDCDAGLYDSTARALVDLPTHLDTIYARIREKAPDAMIITTGYMPLLSMKDECSATANLPGGTLNWAAGLTVTMNAIVRDAAARNGALFVMPPNADFHSVCAPANERWTDPTGRDTDSFPAHPTAAGQKAMAEAVAETLRKL